MTKEEHCLMLLNQIIEAQQRAYLRYLRAAQEFEAGDDTLNAEWDRRHAKLERLKREWWDAEDATSRAECEYYIAQRREGRR